MKLRKTNILTPFNILWSNLAKLRYKNTAGADGGEISFGKAAAQEVEQGVTRCLLHSAYRSVRGKDTEPQIAMRVYCEH